MSIKKMSALFFILLLTAFTAACSSETSGGQESSTAKVKIKDTAWAASDDTEHSAALKVTVTVKNTGKDPLTVKSSDFSLYQDDAKTAKADKEDLLQSGTLHAGKTVTGNLYFTADEGKSYELVYQPQAKDAKPLSYKLKVKGTASNAKPDPADALSAYIDVMLYGKHNKDFTRLTGVNEKMTAAAYQESAKASFITSAGISQEQADSKAITAIIDAMSSALRDNTELKVHTKSMSGKKAVLEAKVTPLDMSPLAGQLQDRVQDYAGKHPDADENEIVSHLLSVYPEEFMRLKPASSSVTREIEMKKNARGQWYLDTDADLEGLTEAFLKTS
ncbi:MULTISPECIES: DUF5105 domain-containing protein [Bacillus amyloliquefaciens group]|uniref:DUF5105 domain-containing protein n=1 Tax=Bacillus amyloliquefaciens group TaxID=1938374 RepID=UPI000D6B2202|nr:MULTISPECIES: DUF5105 domain-containing protein [Bacillus amyloliquefaciens group]AWM42865.1 DUF4352 domain-containing protein [Bacillus amyloliquefaciens]MDL0428181.1 DUF5105 domain-containing protein [Bacillus amyloliquefaciens]NRF34279.1 DUF4354 family protein [Bacillus velezensis]WRT06484.1 DUF5105 domain-containing protein [Bacillus velezensis]